jgi:hypothetical protein
VGGGGTHHLEGRAAKLSNMPSVTTPEAPAAMLVCENEQPFRQVASDIFKIDEAGERRIWRDLHGKVDHTVEHVAEGAVHAAGRLHDTPILGHVGHQPVDVKYLGPPRHTNTGERIRRRPAIDDGAPSSQPRDSSVEFIQAGLAGSAATKPTRRSCVVEG